MTLATRVTALAQAIGADVKALFASAAPPDSLSITYHTEGSIATYVVDGVTRTVAYNSDGTVHTVSGPVGSLTRTETYSYSGGRLSGMTAVEA